MTALIVSLTIFALAMFLGWELITKVPPNLHTPLMSGSNAISGITLVGAIISAGSEFRTLATWLGLAAVILATVNVVGGFLVTAPYAGDVSIAKGAEVIEYRAALVNGAYLIAAVCFILALKGLAHPRTAVRGNLTGAVGMLIAVVATLLHREVVSFELLLIGVVVGGLIGVLLALRTQLTSMPQLVALFNGFGGAASVLVASAALVQSAAGTSAVSLQMSIATAASALIGGVTVSGSLVGMLKLQGIVVPSGAVTSPIAKVVNVLVALAALGAVAMLVASPGELTPYWALVGVAVVLGVTLVIPIGGADMPVVIALLNSYSGLAAAATGFVLDNNALIISGSLVGASGLILTRIMCVAMNRSLSNVLFGGFGAEAAGPKQAADEVYEGKVKATSPEEAAMILDEVRSLVIVPGYGLAVSQAQHAVRELAELLEKRGVEVAFAIHPVAGRMPGHMNVLLAEADIPYEQIKEMDEINPTLADTDAVIVIGANDVVNPVARTDPKSVIAGMPIIDVDKARTVIVIKRSLSPGFAGIPNPLFAADNTMMLFGDGRKAVVGLVNALKEGG
jgi:NAD(P) transhydrogenase subunit beta